MQFIFCLTAILFSLSSFASRARLQALSYTNQLIDHQNIFLNPVMALELDSALILESGSSAPASATNSAEMLALFSTKEDEKSFISFGHQDITILETRLMMNAISGASFTLAQNPVHLAFAKESNMTGYALGVYYSDYKNHTNSEMEKSFGLSAGIELGNLQLSGVYNFYNKAEDNSQKKFDGSGYFTTQLQYLLDSTFLRLKIDKGISRLYDSTTEKENHNLERVLFGFVDSWNKEKNNFFFGAEVHSFRLACETSNFNSCNQNYSGTLVPVWFGIESEFNEFFIIRGSVKQNTALGQYKDDFGYPANTLLGAIGAKTDYVGVPNDSSVNMGLGLKFNRLQIDSILSASTNQNLNLNNFMSQVSLKLSL